MFNIGPAELLVIGVVLLIAVGPEQLPGVIRRVGSAAAQIRSMTDGLRTEFMAGLEEIEQAVDPKEWGAYTGESSAAPRPERARPATGADDLDDDAEDLDDLDDDAEDLEDLEDLDEGDDDDAEDLDDDADDLDELDDLDDLEDGADDATSTNGSAPSNGRPAPTGVEEEA